MGTCLTVHTFKRNDSKLSFSSNLMVFFILQSFIPARHAIEMSRDPYGRFSRLSLGFFCYHEKPEEKFKTYLRQ